MAKKVLSAKGVSASEVDEIVKAFEKLGGTNIKREKQSDGSFKVEATFAS